MKEVLITEEMKEAGVEMSDKLRDAYIRYFMKGLDSSRKSYEEWEESYTGNNLDLVLKYIDDEISSEEAIYTAMERAKQ